MRDEQRLRAARRPFVAMTATYCLGVFNDNFFKQSSMLLAVAAGHLALQGYLAVAFIVPYLLAAAPAGWAADRFSKRHVVIASKALELLAMLIGAVAIVTLSWPLVLVMAFTMGLQSTIFSPAMNGALPELYSDEHLTSANSILKGGMVVAVLAGVALAGVTLEHGGHLVGLVATFEATLAARVAVAAGVVAVALFGLVAALGAPSGPAAAPQAPFPVSGPWSSVRDLVAASRDPMLWLTILVGSFVWSLGSLEAMLVNPLGRSELGVGESATSGLLGAQMLGIGAGGAVAGAVVSAANFRKWLTPGLLVLAAALGATSLLPALPAGARYGAALGLLGVHGLVGGFLLIPCEALVQSRPAPERRGAVLSAYGFLFGAGIVLSGLIANGLNAALAPSQGFLVVAGLTLLLLVVVRRTPAPGANAADVTAAPPLAPTPASATQPPQAEATSETPR